MDLAVIAEVKPENIDLLNRLLEASGHIGIMSTEDRLAGRVRIRVTGDTKDDVVALIEHLPFPGRILRIDQI